MDDTIRVHDLFNKVLCLCFNHGPDLLDSVRILFLETFKLLLNLFIELGLLLEGLRELIILLPVLLAVRFKVVFILPPLGLFGSKSFIIPIFCLLIGLGLLSEYLHIKAELLLVESVHSNHVFHALLKNLHFLLEADLLLRLTVSIV